MGIVAVVVFDGGQVLDAVGPLEVFAGASQMLWEERGIAHAYEVLLLGLEDRPVRMSSGIELGSVRDIECYQGPVETLIVAGGWEAPEVAKNDRLCAALQRLAPRVERLASVCSGAFVLAGAGLVDGRRVATHWMGCELLSERHPELAVDPDAIYVQDGHVWTSAGVTSGIDMALAMVEQDHGHEIALKLAKVLVVFLHRPGSQSQFSDALRGQHAEHRPVHDLQVWIAAHLGQDLSLPVLARRAGMSPRNLGRLFTREVGTPLRRYVQRLRVDAARSLLEQPGQRVDEAAERCGFGTAESMRRAFVRELGVSPKHYRHCFGGG